MQLAFRTEHLSIQEFEPVDLPDFTVLTGVNGSGKSHFLQAIQEHHVAILGIESPRIVRFDYETFQLMSEAMVEGYKLAAARQAAWDFFNSNIAPRLRKWRTQWVSDYEAIKQRCLTSNAAFFDTPGESMDRLRRKVETLFREPKIYNNETALGILNLLKQLPYCIDEITQQEFLRLYVSFSLKNDFLPNQLGSLVWDYYQRYTERQVHEFQNATYGLEHPVITETDFFRLYGPKPWEVMNQILETFGDLRYRVESPEGLNTFATYKLRLKHTDRNDLEVDFLNLSSGEKILMALVASVYKNVSDRYFPEILLLDEIDASLHPSMIKNLLTVINEIFLNANVKVILVTHSPTTIALVPEESVFVMHRSGAVRIEKKSKADALAILTEGFATLQEGLRLYDEVAQSPLTVITEGRNTRLIERALKLSGIANVDVSEGLEAMTGKNQMSTLFDFFSRVPHENKVLFVWDCDVGVKRTGEANKTYPFVLPTNIGNRLATTGIENLFPEALLAGFTKTIIRRNGQTIVEFDESSKKDFENFILERNEPTDFVNFQSLIDEIQRIMAL